jgi:bacteriorhodopsin
MGKNMCQFKFSPKEIEYSSEDKAIFFIFLDFFVFTFFFWFLLYKVEHFFYFFFFVDLLISLSI